MDKIIAFYNQHKDQINMAAVGVMLVLVAYLSYELLVLISGLFIGGTMHQQRKEREEHRERVNEVVKEQQKTQAELNSIRQSQEKTVSEAEAKAHKDVDDFIDGEWK